VDAGFSDPGDRTIRAQAREERVRILDGVPAKDLVGRR
jgi:hypothetical protein